MFRIKKLDIFIAKQFGLLFVGTFFICQFVLMMQFLWRYVDVLIGKGLTVDVLAQFFWYMGLMFVPQALPLAILLSSLITFGNLGESSELTAIKAAGISLLQSFRSLIFITVVISVVSFYFQNVVGPEANRSFQSLLISMKQKSPELEIPEGIFYDGIPQCNIYVQKKNPETGKLYGIMIYRMTGSYEDAAIILADSGMLQSTAEKKHLVLTLHNGEWFENMKSQELAGSASVPYRRESFIKKKIILDFNSDFSMSDASSISGNAKTKSLESITKDIDSLKADIDSMGRVYYEDSKRRYYNFGNMEKKDTVAAEKQFAALKTGFYETYDSLTQEKKKSAVETALSNARSELNDLDFKSTMTNYSERQMRLHQIEAINKFTLALSCLLFFFIGAPLGAIIRKGGLGIPVIISVLVFIVYFIFDNSGFRMSREGIWGVWFGKTIATIVLTPLAVFFTYKANNDSVVFNMDMYRNLFMRMFGLRTKRHVFKKDVIINEPRYDEDSAELTSITDAIETYIKANNLMLAPNPINVFFKYSPDHVIEEISSRLEAVIEDLSNTRDKSVLNCINQYPIMAVKAHTRPFERKWLNVIVAIIIPLGIFFYLRMWRFRLRLMRDLKTITETNSELTNRISELKKM